MTVPDATAGALPGLPRPMEKRAALEAVPEALRRNSARPSAVARSPGHTIGPVTALVPGVIAIKRVGLPDAHMPERFDEMIPPRFREKYVEEELFRDAPEL